MPRGSNMLCGCMCVTVPLHCTERCASVPSAGGLAVKASGVHDTCALHPSRCMHHRHAPRCRLSGCLRLVHCVKAWIVRTSCAWARAGFRPRACVAVTVTDQGRNQPTTQPTNQPTTDQGRTTLCALAAAAAQDLLAVPSNLHVSRLERGRCRSHPCA